MTFSFLSDVFLSGSFLSGSFLPGSYLAGFYLHDLSLAAFDVLEHQIVYTTILFIVLLPAIEFFRNKHPRIAAGLCWLVLARLFIPVDLSSPISLRALVDLFSAWWSGPEVYLPLVPGATELIDYTIATQHISQNADVAWQFYVMLGWALMAAGLIVRFVLVRSRIHRLLANATPVTCREMLGHIKLWRRRLGIRREVALLTSDTCGFAFTTGLAKPVIFIPKKLLRSASPDEVGLLIAHEMVHIKRYDDLSILILSAIQCLYFFFPPVWICVRIIKTSREKLCDAEVLSHGCASANNYCNALLNLVRNMHAQPPSVIASISGHGNELKQRILYLHEENKMKNLNKKAVATVLAITGAVLLPMGAGSSFANKAETDIAFVSPAKAGWISSIYGERPWPVGEDKGKIKFHKGIDIAGDEGTAIFGIAKGIVKEVVTDYKHSANPNLGNYIIVDHGDNMESRYYHLRDVNVEAGQGIEANQQIGTLGKTGQATGAHLHFELHYQGKHVNPADYIQIALPTGKNSI